MDKWTDGGREGVMEGGQEGREDIRDEAVEEWKLFHGVETRWVCDGSACVRVRVCVCVRVCAQATQATGQPSQGSG